MAARDLPNLGLKGFFVLGEDGWDDEMSLNLLKLSVLTQGNVINKVAATPGAPVNGDVYVFDETHPTHPNAVAVRDDGAWVYFVPVEGWRMYDRTNNVLLTFNGATWELDSSAGGATALDDLTDVDLTTTPPVIGDALVWDGTNWVPDAPASGGSSNPWWFNPPLAADFTAVTGDATAPTFVDDADAGFIIRLGAPVAGKKGRFAMTAIPSPAADWTVEFRAESLAPAGEQCLHGLVLRNSVNGKFYVAGRIGHAFDYLVVQRVTAISGGVITDLFADNFVHVEDAKFVKVTYTAATTTYAFYFSVNGKEWMLVASETVAAFLGGGSQANQIGFGVLYDYTPAGGPATQMNCNRFVKSW